MERRILKDFQIGLVEGIVNEVLVKSQEPKDVFSQIAKAIGGRSSHKKSKDWNAIVRKNTVVRDPIGSTQASIYRKHRRSLRRHIIDASHKGLEINTDKLLEYNPKLSEVSQTTRVAYVKFMTKKMKKDDHLDEIFLENEQRQQNQETDEQPSGAFDAVVKKASIIRRASEESMKAEAVLEKSEPVLPPSPTTLETIPDPKDFRARTPIPEDPNEESLISPELKHYPSSKRSSLAECPTPQPTSDSPPKSPLPIITSPTPINTPKSRTPLPSVSGDIDSRRNSYATSGTPTKDQLQPTSRTHSRTPSEVRSPTPSDAISSPPPPPPIIITPSKGKSAVSGRNLEGWI